MDLNLQKIKQIISEASKELNINIEKIILFGSRARGDYREDSDYDILIITKEKLDKEKRTEFLNKIDEKIRYLEIPIDIIIASKETIEKYKGSGFVYFYAIKEGIEI